MKLRSLRVAGVALAMAGLVTSMTPAQAVSGTKSGVVLTAGEWSGLSGEANGMGGVTPNALWTACMADRAALVAGQSATAVSTFINSPLNGVDAIVVDLGANRLPSAVSVKGPGYKSLGNIPLSKTTVFTTDQDIPNYDFDLSFLSAPSATGVGGSGCNDANPGSSTKNPCYSHRSTADESTNCVAKDVDGKGARYIIASLSLNIPVDKTGTGPRPGPVPYTLTWTY